MKGRPLTPDEFWLDIVNKNCGRNVEFKERNELILLLLVKVGLRPIEISLFTNNILIAPTGELNEIFILPESIAFDDNERPVVLDPDVMKAIQKYLSWLNKISINTHPAKSYLGFDPNLPLIVNDDYNAFGLQKRGKKADGSQKNLPITLNKKIDDFIRKSGLDRDCVDRTSFIKTYVIEAFRSKYCIKHLAIFTSLSELTITNYLATDPSQYNEIVEWFVNKKEAKLKRLESFKKRRKYQI